MSNLISILNSIPIPILKEHVLPARTAMYLPVPEILNEEIKAAINKSYPNGLYSHQSNALNGFLEGKDICLATSTSSGKSLVFTAAACHLSLITSDSLTIAVYPARALVHDQKNKWMDFASPLGIKVGQIDGSILVKDRLAILQESQIIVMTPDVIHSWLLSHLGETAADLQRLRLVVLDEAHIYNGVFGTNMAYLFRRLSVLSAPFQIIASTATIGEPLSFLRKLTGRDVNLFTHDKEGTQTPAKNVILTQLTGKGSFDSLARLLRELADHYEGRFLAFADSRKMVDLLTAAAHRNSNKHATDNTFDELETEPEISIPGILMPYRAGYESKDREEIQQALVEGKLRGIVSTSALELGIDIGGIDLVVLLNTPPSIQAFWQRFGRAGRRSQPGECLLIDDSGTVTDLSAYLSKPAEVNYLYLENKFVQFTNALCAARELLEGGAEITSWNQFQDLPPSFLPMLKNEVTPTEIVPDDLYPLKQRAENGAHYEFSLRGGGEVNYQITRMPEDTKLGTMSMAQLVREAYPGAIYYYMATPYRIRETRMRDRHLRASREKYATTKPNLQVTVFPNFGLAGKKWTSSEGFIIECELQVAEQVIGFTEKRGSTTQSHSYEVGSPWSQRPVQRFLKTTGVVWSFGNSGVISESAGEYIVDAFCLYHGVHSREIGFGRFSSNISPSGQGDCKGLSIYDVVVGGLRLTEKFADSFVEVLEMAIVLADNSGNLFESVAIQNLLQKAKLLLPITASPTEILALDGESSNWVTVIADGQPAMFQTLGETREVTVKKAIFLPSGIQYRLAHAKDGIDWRVDKSALEPINGVTQLIRYNLKTGEEIPI